MTNKAKVRLTITALFLLMALAFVGSIAGTLSWYVYYLRATLSFQGTSVADAEQIQVGIEIPENMESIMGLDPVNDDNICWAKPGKGLTASSVNDYLSKAGYARNELVPITSSAYSNNDSLSLTNAPTAGSSYNANDTAGHHKYVQLPLVFRVINVGNSGEDQYAQNKEIWITDFDVAASTPNGGSSKINNAMRIHLNSSYLDQNSQTTTVANFIVRPADDITEGSTQDFTTCAGLLDLNKDGLYDRNGSNEHIYGAYTGTATSTSILDEDQTAISAATNINGVEETPTSEEGYNSFWAMHSAGEILNNYNGLTLAKQYHYSFKQIEPTRDPDHNGRLIDGIPVAKTNNNVDALAYLTLTVWLEGWDHAVVDEAIGHLFNLGITFEVNNTLH